MKNYKIVPLTEHLVEGAIDAVHDTFVKDELICTCVNILIDSPIISKEKHVITEGTKCIEELARLIIKDNISLAAVDSSTGEVIGFAINKYQEGNQSEEEQFLENLLTNLKDNCFQSAINVVMDIESRIDVFKHYNATKAIELFMLCVKNSSKGQGIGQRLVEETIEFSKKHKDAEFVFSYFSFSQRAGIRAGMDTLLTVPYTEYNYKGRLFSDIIGPLHPHGLIAGIKVK